ncbi:MAG: nitroreductase family protein [Planctomycetota bacterium]|jgi:nitroreductase
MLKDLVEKNRSVRRFRQEEKLDLAALRELTELARLCPSGANHQPLRFLLSADPETNGRIFPHLRWAGYLKDWAGPAEAERPTAYVIILGDTAVAKAFGVDHGIAAQTLMLGAAERGFAGCMIGSIDRDGLRQALALPDRYTILLALALGKQAERVVIEDVGPEGDIKYWRDAEGIHHVPKRTLEDLILETPQ